MMIVVISTIGADIKSGVIIITLAMIILIPITIIITNYIVV